ncbi:MAG: hypothetical protein RL213_1193 [Bacteroidota bacterium]
MKRLLLLPALLFSLLASANVVTFCVDMRYYVIDPGGIHLYIEGDTVFHMMTQDPSDTNIYCITLDLPADSCIEYDFLNGSDFYGLEFVPPESRVDDVNSDRWICTHGAGTDTLQTGALLFATNAPEGKTLLRLKVDMLQVPAIDPAGVYANGSVGTGLRMSNLYHGTVYDVMAYLTPGVYDYRFYNGAATETVPAICSVNASREAVLNIDTVVPAVCFSDCIACGTGISAPVASPHFIPYPNPSSARFYISTTASGISTLTLTDLSGKTLREYDVRSISTDGYGLTGIAAGTYFVLAKDEQERTVATTRITVR